MKILRNIDRRADAHAIIMARSGLFDLRYDAVMPDGREEREEQEKRREREKQEDREDRIDRDDPEEWEPESDES